VNNDERAQAEADDTEAGFQGIPGKRALDLPLAYPS